MNLIAVTTNTSELRERAEMIAGRLDIPLLKSAAANDYSFLLTLTPQRLELQQQGKDAPGPIYVDFLAGKVAHRRLFGGGRGQPIAKAIGLKHGLCPSVLDVTAGLGRDAFVLVGLGCRVQLLERSPIIAALLQDGLVRAENDLLIRDNMSLINTDARQYLTQINAVECPDVIYLDPMYPKRSKSALVKKEMRVLQHLIGNDNDAPELLANALPLARQRVVVKRPRLAPGLDGPEPDFRIEAKTTRFDIYLSPKNNKSAMR